MGCYQRIIYCFTFLAFVKESKPNTNILYDTKTATSDLDWTLHPLYTGWEELSGLDLNGDTIRSYQVCNVEEAGQDNWARSPFIDAKSAKRVYIDIEFSVMKCPDCRETFTLYYYPSSPNVASSTFPPWRENPFIKIDTVAASERFDSDSAGPRGINKKTFVIGRLQRRGLYMAIQDQGACMSLMSMKLYYHYCPELTHNLAYFPKTVAGGQVASLIAVDGKCVSNAVYANNEVPKYRCNSNGEWKVPTGMCQCRPGYWPRTGGSACQACKVGFYKSMSGNQECTRCPSHSNSHSVGSTACMCTYGYYRSASETTQHGCTRPPSSLNNLTFIVNSTEVSLNWSPPFITGNREDTYYRVSCKLCDSTYRKCIPCSEETDFVPSDPSHVTETQIKVTHLEPFSNYLFKVEALNGVSAISKKPPGYKTVRVTTSANIPSPVEDLSIVWKDGSSISLRWSEPRLSDIKITGYEIVLKRLSGLDPSSQATPSRLIQLFTTNITIYGLMPVTTYSVSVRAQSTRGFGKYCDDIVFTTNPAKPSKATPISGDSTGIFVGAIAAVAIILFAVVITLLVWRRKTQRRRRDKAFARSKLADGESGTGLVSNGEFKDFIPGSRTHKTYVDYRDPHQGVKEIACEVDVSRLKIDCVIGQGEFGEVCKGKLTEGQKSRVVAVKRLKHGASLIDQTNFLREACTMAQFSHPNIVQFRGVITKNVPAMLIIEFMENGSLNKFLGKKRGQLSVSQLLKMLKGIASGMKYLSDMKYVHRDLAARNILVNSELVCKVSDFGLSRTLENDPNATYTTQGGKIALRWTAPECIHCRKFTSASDVWSYGIVMWEVLSYGEKPYWDMSNDEVTDVIEDGYRLPAPTNCPKPLHNLMLSCWSYEAGKRPACQEVLAQLNQFIRLPSLLKADSEPEAPSTPLLSPDNPTNLQDVSNLDEWLDMVRLGRYRRSFYAHGISDLETLAHISTSDLERLGIASPAHRTRLQSSIDILRNHISSSPAEANRTPRMSSTLRPSSEVTPVDENNRSLTLPLQRPHPTDNLHAVAV